MDIVKNRFGRLMIVPLPPIEVQREIVRILDDFTEQTEQLKASLTAELTARKKQYEYYRDKLLALDVFGGGQVNANEEHLAILQSLLTAIQIKQKMQVMFDLLE